MALINIPFTFTVGAVIVASQHNSNFSIIYSDYNGNIDNANISASAAIADSKLAQITTASKVSGAALTSLTSIISGAGKIPVANIDTGTTANKIVILDGSAKLPAVDGSQLTNTPSTTTLGAWTSKSSGTTYQAATDGFVTAFVQVANNNTQLYGYTDSNASPTTLRAASSLSAGAGATTPYLSVFFPVRKNDYYKVTYGTADSFTMFFIPLGT